MNKLNLSKNKRYDFDITINSDTYAGELALPYVRAALRSPDTIAKGYVRQIEGLNKSAVISEISSSNPIVAASCGWTAGANTSTSEQVLTLTDMKVNEEICRGTVFPTWYGQGMDRNGNLPQAFGDFLLETVAAKAAAQLEIALWQGASPFGTGFLSDDGTQDQTGADASAMKDFSEVDFADALAASDILTDMASVYDKVASDVSGLLTKPGAGFYMNNKTYGFYIQALASAGSNQGQVSGAGFNLDGDNMTYFGFPVYRCPGMFNDTIVFTYPENLVVGSNTNSGWQEIRLIPKYEFDGSDNVGIVMQFAMGVQTAVATDGVYGSTVWT
tara:strand:+ start:11327 stop:12316 length:990 start_codon:yes stop_codon:yes gene_type:complete